MADVHGYDRQAEVDAVAAEMSAHGGADSFAQAGRLPEGTAPPVTIEMPFGGGATHISGVPGFQTGTPPPREPDLGKPAPGRQ